MGIILIVLAVLIMAIVALIVVTRASNKYHNYDYVEREKATKFEQICYRDNEGYTFVAWTMIVATLIILIGMTIGIIAETIQADALKASYTETYNSLIYKMESTTCRDEFGFLNKEVIDEVTEWNETISYNKIAQDNIWVGCFVPNIYDDFELIDYTSFVPKKIWQ